MFEELSTKGFFKTIIYVCRCCFLILILFFYQIICKKNILWIVRFLALFFIGFRHRPVHFDWFWALWSVILLYLWDCWLFIGWFVLTVINIFVWSLSVLSGKVFFPTCYAFIVSIVAVSSDRISPVPDFGYRTCFPKFSSFLWFYVIASVLKFFVGSGTFFWGIIMCLFWVC